MEKMMEQILARMDADKEELIAKMDSNQKKAEAKKEDMLKRMDKMESNQEKMDADRLDNQFLLTIIKEEDRRANKDFLARMEAIFDDNRKKAESDK
jgi:hypothetical protein